MAQSPVEICNAALIMIGDSPIASLDDATDAARACSNLWEITRDAALALHAWNCATRRTLLAAETDTPAWGYSYQFSKPADCLRILDLDGVTDYVLEGRKILCNESSLQIRYIYRNETTTEYDALFVEALAAYMAYKLTYALTKSNSTREQAKQYFGEILKQAKAVDSIEAPGQQLGQFGLINKRR